MLRPAVQFPIAPTKHDNRGVQLTRILVVDDSKELRELVCLLLKRNQKLRVVGEASDGSEAVRTALELAPDLIVLDIDLPKVNGIDAARQIQALIPQSKIIFLSTGSSPDLVQQVLSSKCAWGYVLKLKVTSDLLAAVEAVLLGAQFVSKELAVEVDAGRA